MLRETGRERKRALFEKTILGPRRPTKPRPTFLHRNSHAKRNPSPPTHPLHPERNRSGSRPQRTSRNKNRIPSEPTLFVSVPGTMTSLTFEQQHRPKSLCKQRARSSQREQKGPIVLRSLITISFPRFASLQTPTWDKAHFSSDVSIPTRFMALNGGVLLPPRVVSKEKGSVSFF
ncbi:hypothetical protein CDAR_76731 [Caerostris darwini]|uniref:Uncharacterized protein n=1 Tax=Caerostris darwini TaxID=1538125 RepID=A0AAV4QD19_9ARAC|nr:hypothetical protein CDAR_76731 [Caerostris darwini]